MMPFDLGWLLFLLCLIAVGHHLDQKYFYPKEVRLALSQPVNLAAKAAGLILEDRRADIQQLREKTRLRYFGTSGPWTMSSSIKTNPQNLPRKEAP